MFKWIFVFIIVSISFAIAQSSLPTDAVYWCNVSRSQVSIERDASLAQIENLKLQILKLENKIKEFEDKSK